MNSQILKNIKSYVMMTVGLFIFVFSWTAFLIPHEIAGGGVSGLASVINYATGFKVAYSYMMINGVLLLIGFLVLGKAFGFKTIFCISLATLMFEFLPLIPWIRSWKNLTRSSDTFGGLRKSSTYRYSVLCDGSHC